MTKKISQREAVRLKKRVRELENKLENIRAHGWPGALIDTWNMSDVTYARVKTADILGYTLILKRGYTGTDLEVRAVKL